MKPTGHEQKTGPHEESYVPLLTVHQFSRKHQAFPEGGLRYLIFNAEQNGFNRCIRRVGRKVLIHETEFFAWIEQTNKAGA